MILYTRTKAIIDKAIKTISNSQTVKPITKYVKKVIKFPNSTIIEPANVERKAIKETIAVKKSVMIKIISLTSEITLLI